MIKVLEALGLLAIGLVLMACSRNSDTALGAGSDPLHSSGKGAGSSTQSQGVDNKGVKVQDGSESTLIPEDQGASQADLQITHEIRRTITSDPQLSTQAKNVKVATVNGKVTLRGSVSNVPEERALASIARRIAGVDSVDNQLEVKINESQ